MKLSNKTISIIFFLLSICSYVTSGILNLVNKDNSIGYIFLCFGSAFLCFGSVWLNKSNKDDDSEHNDKTKL